MLAQGVAASLPAGKIVRKRREQPVANGLDDDGREQGYAVGYGKPPKQYSFRPGASGNPKGRPKSSKNFVTLVEQELDTVVPVTENGRTIKVSKRRLSAKQLANKVAKGDERALLTFLKLPGRGEGAVSPATTPSTLPVELADQILAAFRRQVIEEEAQKREQTDDAR